MGGKDDGGRDDLILSALNRLEAGQKDTSRDIKDLTEKVEKNITQVEVLKVRQDETRKDLDEHKVEHVEGRKWWWGMGAAAILGAGGWVISVIWNAAKAMAGQ